LAAQQPESSTDFGAAQPLRPVATYSILARDPATGEMGVAVQSHWFSVGSIVTWAEAGVGAIATQSFVEPAYGQKGLELMRAGKSAPETLAQLLAADSSRAVRQVAMIDAQGRVAAHTGKSSIAAAGDHVGAQYSVQANLMDNADIWPAMARAFEKGEGDLAERMLLALEAAQTAGGDIRGCQSAAILIVRPTSTGRPWVDRKFDLRVEDDPDPVGELRRLVRLQRAYLQLNAGDEHVTNSDLPAAMAAYKAAMELLTDQETNGEAPYWVGITLASQGKEDEAAPYLKRAYAQNRKWAALTTRLPAAGLLPDVAMARRLIGLMTRP
ncbi:MAG: DUF1028 domain-containing protein, partial [Gemmatimonadetes bacterium]|nr:DUF1028 domain-containing protein [Gemmatimonadota bacterium]